MRAQYFRGNVFVANLPPDLTEDELAEAFDPFGIVLSAFIARDPETGKRLRYGFVDIATERAALLAVKAMNGTEIDGHNLDVRISERPNKPKKRTARPGTHASGTRAAATRPAPRHGSQPTEASDPYTTPVPQRRQPTFQIERRSLPRRV
jgi:RNA recognition motif-containing protein